MPTPEAQGPPPRGLCQRASAAPVTGGLCAKHVELPAKQGAGDAGERTGRWRSEPTCGGLATPPCQASRRLQGPLSVWISANQVDPLGSPHCPPEVAPHWDHIARGSSDPASLRAGRGWDYAGRPVEEGKRGELWCPAGRSGSPRNPLSTSPRAALRSPRRGGAARSLHTQHPPGAPGASEQLARPEMGPATASSAQWQELGFRLVSAPWGGSSQHPALSVRTSRVNVNRSQVGAGPEQCPQAPAPESRGDSDQETENQPRGDPGSGGSLLRGVAQSTPGQHSGKAEGLSGAPVQLTSRAMSPGRARSPSRASLKPF